MMQSLAPAPTSAMQSPSQDVVSEQILREQLLSQVTTTPNHARDHHEIPTSSPTSPHDPQSLDHTMSGSGMMSGSAGSDDGNDNDGRKGYGKRELSTSKRAAQNRAAQRAFRQRKEGYIKKLEEQVRDYNILNDSYKTIQAENFQLRDYIINLQTHLTESQGDFPQPPPNIDGLHPGGGSHSINTPGPAQPAPILTPAPPTQQHQIPVTQNLQQQQQTLADMDQMRTAGHPSRPSDPRRPTTDGEPYRDSKSPSAPKVKADGREMTAAQKALQGRTDR